jgi:hypothetical protein
VAQGSRVFFVIQQVTRQKTSIIRPIPFFQHLQNRFDKPRSFHGIHRFCHLSQSMFALDVRQSLQLNNHVVVVFEGTPQYIKGFMTSDFGLSPKFDIVNPKYTEGAFENDVVVAASFYLSPKLLSICFAKGQKGSEIDKKGLAKGQKGSEIGKKGSAKDKKNPTQTKKKGTPSV